MREVTLSSRPRKMAAVAACGSQCARAEQSKFSVERPDTTAVQDTGRGIPNLRCVLDVSGSMANNATKQNDKGETEGYGIPKLDIVKHVVKTYHLQPDAVGSLLIGCPMVAHESSSTRRHGRHGSRDIVGRAGQV